MILIVMILYRLVHCEVHLLYLHAKDLPFLYEIKSIVNCKIIKTRTLEVNIVAIVAIALFILVLNAILLIIM